MDIVSTDKAPAAIGPYVQGRIVGDFLFASGQIPLDPASGEIVGTTIKEQTAQVMSNIAAVLESVGAGFENIVKTTCFLDDMNDFVPFNEEYARWFGETKPARSAVEVAALPKGALVEVEVIAYLG